MRNNRRKRHTLKQYETLYRNPADLFPGNGVNSEPVSTILYPDGQSEIILRDETGRAYRIKASRGPAGFGLSVDIITYANGRADISGNRGVGATLEGFHVKDACHIEICQYDQTPAAQAHRAWYAGEALHPTEIATNADGDLVSVRGLA